MTKIWNYVVIITGISLLMALGGLQIAGFSTLFQQIGLTTNSNGISNFEVTSSLWNSIFGTTGLLIAILGGSAIGIGAFIYTQDKAFLMIPIITGTFFYWISAIVSIVNYTKGYPVFGVICGIILVPLTVGFILSCVEWFMGLDT